MKETKKYRLVTRGDFDGLVCAALLRQMGMIDEITLVHPKDMQDGKIPITDRDITTNLPYVKGAHMVFDHHLSETIRVKGAHDNYIIDPHAPSTARIVYNYFGGQAAFPNISLEMMDAVDIADSAKYTAEDILYPKKWALLNFIMDSRTGFGRFQHFKISNHELMMLLVESCSRYTIDEILNLPDVKERVNLYFKYEPLFNQQLDRCSTAYGEAVVIDLRHEEVIYPGNRFTIYTIYPRSTVSIHIFWGHEKQKIVLTVGKSIFNKTSAVNIGALMLEYGGGGHTNAGTCQVDVDSADEICQEIVRRINKMSK